MFTDNKKNTLFKLKPAKTLKLDFFVFDTETVETKGNKKRYTLRGKSDSFYFGVVYGHNYTKVITSVEEFKEEFKHPRYKDKKVFAHNAEYDLSVLYDNIYEFDSKAIFNGKFICATNGNCLFADSMNIYPTSVKALGSLLKLEKEKLNGGLINRWFYASKGIPAKDINYCIRDCEIVYEALFQAFEFSGQIAITQASLSMLYFRRYHLAFNIKHNPKKTELFFNSYYGGRTECFQIGKTESYVYDANSLYPFVMKEKAFPNPYNFTHIQETKPSSKKVIKKFISIMNEYEGMAFIKVKHSREWLGYLPVRDNGKLIFPIGTFEGWFNFPEIRFALEHNVIEILEVKEFLFSSRMKSPFKSFVEQLYNQRFSTDNDFEIYRIKIFMNSLYGKFGQRIKEENIYIKDQFSNEALTLIKEHQQKGTLIKIQTFKDREDCFLTVKSEKVKTFPHSIPSFASYVTTYGRLELLKKLIANHDKNPVYCDTDSIFIEKEISSQQTSKISISNIPILGEWKKENKIVTQINGLKDYFYTEKGENKRALKGVPKSAKEIEPNVFEYENLTKTKEALRRNLESGIKIKRVKKLTGIYDKRIVLSNGKTKPIEL